MKDKRELIHILELVCQQFGLTVKQFKNSSRTSDIIFASKAYYYIASKKTSCSLNQIGRLRGVHHSTVIHHIKDATNLMDGDNEFSKGVKAILYQLEPGFEPVTIYPASKEEREMLLNLSRNSSLRHYLSQHYNGTTKKLESENIINIGDCVMLRKNPVSISELSHYNPLNTEGTVIKITDNNRVIVKWENGSQNSYRINQLKKLKI